MLVTIGFHPNSIYNYPSYSSKFSQGCRGRRGGKGGGREGRREGWSEGRHRFDSSIKVKLKI